MFNLGGVENTTLYTIEIYRKLSLNGWFKGIKLLCVYICIYIFLVPYSSPSYIGELQGSFVFVFVFVFSLKGLEFTQC